MKKIFKNQHRRLESRSPFWMQSAKNRDVVLKAIAKLEQKEKAFK
ncbi:hypothetical protein [Bacillus sp. S10(2024)]